jgi:hypothetical protein
MGTANIRRVAIAALFLAALPLARASTALGAETWRQIASFSGPGGKPEDTAPFTTSGGKVRFAFTVQPNSSGPVPFLSTMYLKGTPVTPNELHRTQCIDCNGKQTDDLGNVRAGSYYLHVITSRPWTLIVEEAK